MKNLFVILILSLLLTGNIYAQTFTATTGVSSGLEVDAKGNFTEIQGTFSLQPQIAFDKFTVSAVGLTLFKSQTPSFLVGSQLGYVVWTNPAPTANTVALTGRYLYGPNEQLIGAGLDYGVNRTTISFNGDWNYDAKTALLTLGLNYEFLK